MARLEPEGSVPAREPVALAALLREEIAALVPMALRRGQDIELEADETLPAVAGDPLLLGVLARNLVDNALRYSPDDTTVRVSLAPVQGGVALRVQDQGPGIPADAVERVFERFWRAQSGRGDGAGLGLAIVRRIAELHGGTVAAVPRRGDQAGCLEVVLPARG
jgi:signal transduction histidine kinase